MIVTSKMMTRLSRQSSVYTPSPGGETTESINVSPLTTTGYTCEYTLNGCASTPAIETVTVTATPTVTVADESICDGGSAVLTAVPSVGGGTYVWSPGGQTSNSITDSPATTTAYSVVYSLNGCPSLPVNATINVGTTPTLAVNDETICEGNSIILNPTPSVVGGTYFWTPTSETTPTITVTPAGTAAYDVVYTLNGCPSNTETITVNVTPAPLVTAINETICEGETVTLNAVPNTPGGSYLWLPTNETTTTIDVSPTTTTAYSVEYYLNGCVSIPQILTVTVSPTPAINIIDQSICDGGSATLTAVPSIGGGTYLWSPGNETTSSITESPSITTSYSVVYTLNGCPGPSEVATITVGTTPTISVQDEVICEGESITLSPTPSVGGGTYLWTPNLETTPTITVSPTLTTPYDVVYTLNGCPSSTETINVIVNSLPFVNATSETICEGETATLIATPSTGGGTYEWQPGGSTSNSVDVSPTVTTTYTVIYTLNECESSPINTIVTVNPTPALTVNDLTLCDIATGGIIDATASLPGGTYLWSPGGETTPSISVPTTNGTYSVIYTLNGCPSTSEVATVTITTGPSVAVTEVNNEITSDQNGATYQWIDCNNGDAVISGATGQTYIPTVNGSYAVIVDITGCIDTSACTIISTIGIDEIDGFSFTVHPNPTTGTIHLTGISDVNLNYEVIDMMGKVVINGTLDSNYIIDLRSLSTGAYTLNLDGKMKTRIIKK
jgi:hypothetical protein